MTKKNMHSAREPFLLKPAAKDYIWGGNRLNDDFSKNIDKTPLAETWECSTHPDGISIISTGIFSGKLLTDILYHYPEMIGSHPLKHGFPKGQLPIMIKLIDAQEDLSVQVHPSDEQAREQGEQQRGKTEFWYVLDAQKGSRIAYGLLRDTSKKKMRQSIEEGTIENLLQFVPVKKNDIFYVETGTIHAIGAGVLIAEIQENSNLTYRLYDYNRIDKNGKKRDLHIEKALSVSTMQSSRHPRQPLRVLRYRPGCAEEMLCRCEYFQIDRILFNTGRIREMVTIGTDASSFCVLLCIDGCGEMLWEDSQIPLFRGDCIFVPAKSVPIRMHGIMQVLRIKC